MYVHGCTVYRSLGESYTHKAQAQEPTVSATWSRLPRGSGADLLLRITLGIIPDVLLRDEERRAWSRKFHRKYQYKYKYVQNILLYIVYYIFLIFINSNYNTQQFWIGSGDPFFLLTVWEFIYFITWNCHLIFI